MTAGMGSFDFVEKFYEQDHSRENFIEAIDALLSEKNLSVSAIPFYSHLSPDEYFPTKQKTREISLEKQYDGYSFFNLTYSYKLNKEVQKASGKFFVYNHPEYPKVCVALTIEPSRFLQKALLPYLKSMYPKVVTTFITNKRLRKLMTTFREEQQFNELVVTQANHRFRIMRGQKQEKTVPVVSWPGIELDEAFEWVLENNGWFNSIKFQAQRHFRSYAEILFTRQGIIRTNQLFSIVFKALVLPVCKTIYENVEIFGHRSRKETSDLSVRPLAIDFELDQFGPPPENVHFIDAMKTFPVSSISVVHGNPYIQLSVIDYYDGSAFDIWVLNSNQLIIVPQFKGTVASIKRIINHIFDTFAEGKIRDLTES